MISNQHLQTIIDQLHTALVNFDDGFMDYVDEDTTVEMLVYQANEQLEAFQAVKNEMTERGLSVDDYDTSFDFDARLEVEYI